MASMKPRRPPSVSDDDARLFREAVGPVRRAREAAPPPRGERPAPRPHMSQRDEVAVIGDLLTAPIDPTVVEVGEELAYLRDGYPPRMLKRLKQGGYAIQDEIDLHQMNAAAARATIADFLAENLRAGRACVKIIHGKGLRSSSAGPVLKKLTDGLLRRHGDVLAFASARAAQGGTGAVVVLLRRRD